MANTYFQGLEGLTSTVTSGGTSLTQENMMNAYNQYSSYGSWKGYQPQMRKIKRKLSIVQLTLGIARYRREIEDFMQQLNNNQWYGMDNSMWKYQSVTDQVYGKHDGDIVQVNGNVKIEEYTNSLTGGIAGNAQIGNYVKSTGSTATAKGR